MLTFKRATAASLLLLASWFIAVPAQAGDYISMNVGKFDVFDDTYDAALFGAEYQMEAVRYDLRPTFGGFFTSEGSLYGYAGVRWDIALFPQQLYLIPNFAVGAYSDGDDGKDLGGTIEFRSGIELAYQFENEHRVGIALNHLSNAGMYDRNPGEENLLVTYSVPLNNIGGMIGGNW